jgi:hypothetical protein
MEMKLSRRDILKAAGTTGMILAAPEQKIILAQSVGYPGKS